MKIIVLGGSSGTMHLTRLRGRHLLAAAASLLLLTALGSYLGAAWAPSAKRVLPPEVARDWQVELDRYQRRVAEARRKARAKLQQLHAELGKAQAGVSRLNALGRRLTKVAGVSPDEFDLSQAPAMGGPKGLPLADEPSARDLETELEALNERLAQREEQMAFLEKLLTNRNKRSQSVLAGRPIDEGWLSSSYGRRPDPFTGQMRFHDGLDYAAREGTPVQAVASGVVSWAGRKAGYGHLVEVNHGGGLKTRYGHNQKNLVEVGDVVHRGDVVARVGNTGRSTGPHVHFEVIEDGQVVNPVAYVE